MEKISNEKILENVTGGFVATFAATNTLIVSSNEYKKLENAKYIVDGKLKHSDVNSAISFLKEKGCKGNSQYLCFMWRGYKAPEYANLVIE